MCLKNQISAIIGIYANKKPAWLERVLEGMSGYSSVSSSDTSIPDEGTTNASVRPEAESHATFVAWMAKAPSVL